MLQLIKKLLKQIIDDIDTGNSNISYEEQCKILHLIQNMTDKDQRMSKIQACDIQVLVVLLLTIMLRTDGFQKDINRMGLRNCLG